MKTILFLLAILFSVPASADPRIDNMFAHCRCVMEGGVCKFANRPPLKPGARVFTALGPISAAAYNDLKAQGVLMCVAGKEACEAGFDSERCRTFRTWYRQEPVVCTKK
jgi:hypothetical protein